MANARLVLVITMSLFSLFIPVVGARPNAQSQRMHCSGTVTYPSHGLQVDGKRIVDEEGRQVLLRGFSLWDAGIFEPQWHYPYSVEHLQWLKDWGFNVIRTSAWWGRNIEPYEDQVGVYSEENLVDLEAVVQNAGDAGLYVIISVRVQYLADPAATWDGWGEADMLLTSEGLQRYCNMLEMLVQRFDSYPQVIGYCPWHFPWHHVEEPQRNDTTVQQYYDTITPAMINAIRAHSSKIIFYSPYKHGLHLMSDSYPWCWDTGEFDFITPVPQNNVVYMHDGHRPLDVEQKGATWDSDVEFIRSQMSYAKAFSDKYNVPMCLAEFGLNIHGAQSTRPIDQSRLNMLDAKLTVLDDYGDYNWLYWLYTNDEVGAGVLESDLSPSAVVPLLQDHVPPALP